MSPNTAIPSTALWQSSWEHNTNNEDYETNGAHYLKKDSKNHMACHVVEQHQGRPKAKKSSTISEALKA